MAGGWLGTAPNGHNQTGGVMHKFEFRLDEELHEALKKRASDEKKSISSVVRELLRAHLGLDREAGKYTGMKFIGSGCSGKSDISVRHDDYLAEDFK